MKPNVRALVPIVALAGCDQAAGELGEAMPPAADDDVDAGDADSSRPVSAPAAPAAAGATCLVDRLGTVSAPPPGYDDVIPDVDAGIGQCSHFSLYCSPGSQCEHQAFELAGQTGIVIDEYPNSGSMVIRDITGVHGGFAVRVLGSSEVQLLGSFGVQAVDGQPAVLIDGADQVSLEGPMDITGIEAGVIVQLSTKVSLVGQPGVARMNISSSGGAALEVVHLSEVTAEAVRLHESGIGLHVRHLPQGTPSSRTRFTGRELTIEGNEVAGRISGGHYDPQPFWSGGTAHDVCLATRAAPGSGYSVVDLELGGGQQPNYVLGNVSGFEVYGSSKLNIDHAIFNRNMHKVPDPERQGLLVQRDNAQIVARQILAFDNDDNGLSVGQSYSVVNASCNDMFIYSSTFANHEVEQVMKPYDPSGGTTAPDHLARIHVLWSLIVDNADLAMSCSAAGDAHTKAYHSDVSHPCRALPQFAGVADSGLAIEQQADTPAGCMASEFANGNWVPSHGTSISHGNGSNLNGCIHNVYPPRTAASDFSVVDPQVQGASVLSLSYPALHTDLFQLQAPIASGVGPSWPTSTQQAFMGHTMPTSPPADLFPAGTSWTSDGVNDIDPIAWEIGYKNPR